MSQVPNPDMCCVRKKAIISTSTSTVLSVHSDPKRPLRSTSVKAMGGQNEQPTDQKTENIPSTPSTHPSVDTPNLGQTRTPTKSPQSEKTNIPKSPVVPSPVVAKSPVLPTSLIVKTPPEPVLLSTPPQPAVVKYPSEQKKSSSEKKKTITSSDKKKNTMSSDKKKKTHKSPHTNSREKKRHPTVKGFRVQPTQHDDEHHNHQTPKNTQTAEKKSNERAGPAPNPKKLSVGAAAVGLFRKAGSRRLLEEKKTQTHEETVEKKTQEVAAGSPANEGEDEEDEEGTLDHVDSLPNENSLNDRKKSNEKIGGEKKVKSKEGSKERGKNTKEKSKERRKNTKEKSKERKSK